MFLGNSLDRDIDETANEDGEQGAKNIMTRDSDFGESQRNYVDLNDVGEGSREQGFGNLVEAGEALAPLGSKISLMILNMEGYEFRLLPYLMKKGLLGQVKRLAVQWHPFEQLKLETIAWQDPTNEMLALLGSPAWPHKLVYDERPTWTYSEAR